MEKAQKALYELHKAPYRAVNLNEMIGISQTALNGAKLIHGLRHPSTDTTSGWYIWSGELLDSPDFFQPLHLEHAIKLRPDIIPYLGLPPGWRFMIDTSAKHEDVWRDETLLSAQE